MNPNKHAVKVTIGGEDYTVKSELPPEYTREVAAYVDAALKRVKDMVPMVESHKAARIAKWRPGSTPSRMIWPAFFRPPSAAAGFREHFR